MEYIVKVRLKGKDGKVVAEWPEKLVDAEEKWDALVKVAEELGISERITMSDLWRMASIRKKERKDISIRRRKE